MPTLVLVRDENGVPVHDLYGNQVYALGDITVTFPASMAASLCGTVRVKVARRVDVEVQRSVSLYVDRHGYLQTRRRVRVHVGNESEEDDDMIRVILDDVTVTGAEVVFPTPMPTLNYTVMKEVYAADGTVVLGTSVVKALDKVTFYPPETVTIEANIGRVTQ